MSWFSIQVTKPKSLIIQVFVKPFKKPWVVLADFRESQDIPMRRTKKFDQATNFRDVLLGFIPDHQVIMATSNWTSFSDPVKMCIKLFWL
jgi:hypothetical protein